MRYLWDDAAAMCFDYDFLAGKRSDYFYATAFYPLWAGLLSADEAQRLARHLPEFLHPGGMAMSTRVTGAQWDLPFGWAPMHFLTVEGLRRYGMSAQADAVTERWLRMIVENFRHEGTLREKYDVITRSSDVQVQVGYTTNVPGFGWTNATVLRLLPELPEGVQQQILTPPPAPAAYPSFKRWR
jgi:alpha,alpha-trehalase